MRVGMFALAASAVLSSCRPAPRCVAQFPASITEASELSADCSPYLVKGYSEIDAPLTIDPGVHVQLTSGASLVVNATGTLTVHGLASAPVVFEPVPGADAWDQIAIDGPTANADLQYVEFVDGGAAHSSFRVAQLDRSALQISSGAGVRLQHVRIVNGNSVGLRVTSSLVAGSTDVAIVQSLGAPVAIGADVMGSLPPVSVTPASPASRIRINAGNVVSGVATWASQSVPIEIADGNLNVVATGGPTQLMIAAPNSLIFDPGAVFDIGADAGVTLNGAISLDALDAVAGWGGLVFERGSAASEISGGSIAHGCGGSFSSPAVCGLARIDGTAGWPNVHDEAFSAPAPKLGGHSVCLVLTSPASAPPPSGYPAGAAFFSCGDANVLWNGY